MAGASSNRLAQNTRPRKRNATRKEKRDDAPDLRISATLVDHRKTKRLHMRMGANGFYYLIRLLSWVRIHRTDGDLCGLTAEDIELDIGWNGKPGEFIAALSEVGFVDGEECAYHMHDWAEHQPYAASTDERRAAGKWNAIKRFHGIAEAARQMPTYAEKLGIEIVDVGENMGTPHVNDGLPMGDPSNRDGLPMGSPMKSDAPSPSPSPKSKELFSSANADAEDDGGKSETIRIERRVIPSREIVRVYHEQLPMLPQVRQLTEKRKQWLKARWMEHEERQTVEWWNGFFRYVSESDFLTGRNGQWTGCSFEWLINSSNFVKVIEGNYENKHAA